MGGGAWPFLVGGVICLVNSVNERDLGLLISHGHPAWSEALLRGTLGVQPREVQGNNRSVMPLDVLGRTRATLVQSTSFPSDPWSEGPGNLRNCIVMGIDSCNF